MNESDQSANKPFVYRDARVQSDLKWTLPAVLLLAANLVPLAGVLFAGWSLLQIVALYWFENVVIGAINVLKMLTCAPDLRHLQHLHSVAARRSTGKASAASDRLTAIGHHGIKAFFIPFFIVHYGIFCLVHGVFVFALLGDQGRFDFGGGPFELLRQMLGNMFSEGTGFAALALTSSHLISYGYHFLFRGEFRRTNVALLMIAPYGRILVLHIAILFGAFATHLLGQPVILLLLLIIGKTLLDWAMHVRAHNKLRDVEGT